MEKINIQKNILLKIVGVLVIFALVFGTINSGSIPTYADSASDLQKQLDAAEKAEKDARAEYKKKKDEEKAIANMISAIETSISLAEKELKNLNAQIEKTDKEIATTTQEVIDMEAEVASQNNDLNQRLSLMYESGDMSMIEVLLGSENIVDFLNNIEMVKTIHEYDMAVLDELNAKLDAIEKKKSDLDKMKVALEADKKAQIDKEARLAIKKEDLKAAKVEAHQDVIDAWNDVEDTAAESAAIENQLRNLQSNGTYGGGALGWPVPSYSRVSSEYGYRVHPISGVKKLHAGIDIPCAKNTSIVAAADGVVIMATYNGGYGNVVIIDHGSNISTLYAHNTSLVVSAGQTVTRGQKIANAGTTGSSTGVHCHFEVRVKGATVNPRGWL